MSDDWARPVVHWEIQARDAQKQREFYSQMFNWDITDGPIMNIPAGIGGPEPGPGGHIREGAHPGLSLYIQVRDLKFTMEKAEQLGGQIIMQPRDTPQGPTIAGISDPEGNAVMLVQQ
jgi:predicted enzyme related to lactoylglutathione lyase